MSCTENENGPFVVFFMPAVVGCLTILLARRWANSQGSSTSSTAVSRRRKIIKDPLVKRPLPTVSPKMVAPANKKATAGGKKVTYVNDEDLVTNGKGKNKAARVSPAGGPDNKLSVKVSECKAIVKVSDSKAIVKVSDCKAIVKVSDCKAIVKVADNKVADNVTNKTTLPKHIPFPAIPQDGELLFEAMTFMFMTVATGLQYMNIYRTTSWISPKERHYSMNLYLIDWHVVAVILTILFRRFLYTAIMKLWRKVIDPKHLPKAVIATRLIVIGIIGGFAGRFVYFVSLKYPPIKIFYLCYPVVIYFLLFGLQIGPLVDLGSPQTVFHSCSSNPEEVTAEVEALRLDFNRRASRILFNSIIGAYYSSFIPCCFVQPFVYYDVYGASQQVCFVWGGLFARYINQLTSATLCDTLHRAALHLPKLHPELISASSEMSWANSIKLWTGGTKEGVSALKMTHLKYYTAFKSPPTLLSVALCLHLSLITLQLCVLLSSLHWNTFLATLLLLFINYYTLFKMVRDYVLAWKVYRAESLIQQKHANLALALTHKAT